MATYDPDQSEMNEQASDNIIVSKNNGKQLEELIDNAINNYVSTERQENECATNSNRLQNNGGYVFDYERNRGLNKIFKKGNESFGYGYNRQDGNTLAGYSGLGRANHHRDMEERGNSCRCCLCRNTEECFKIKENDKPTGPPKQEYIQPDIEVKELVARFDAGLNLNTYESIDVKVSGNDQPKWISSFLDSGLLNILLKNLHTCNFLVPTPIQKYAIPVIMSGRDILASAQTGFGKTAAYVLPILHDLLSKPTELIFDKRHCEPHVVIMAPTGELAIQICKCVRKLSEGTDIKCGVLYGEQSRVYQMLKIVERGAHVLVVTPGRLKNFVELGIVTLGSVKFFVLDEIDKMLDMGCLPAMEFIMKHPTVIPSELKQTIMFSATFPSEIQQMAASYMKSDYILVTVDKIGETRKDIVQTVISVTKFKKREALLNLFKDMDDCQGTIVFVKRKRMVDFIAAYLCDQDFPTTSIHSDRKQEEQVTALNNFQKKNMKILIAQQVATRGHDIKGINNIVYFDLPKKIKEYKHQIGHAGRIGNAGKAISFFDPNSDIGLAAILVRVLKQAKQDIPLWLHDFAGERQFTPVHN